MKAITILAKYFNVGDGKRPLGDFRDEVSALNAEEKHELATLAAAAMGVDYEPDNAA